MRPSAAFLGCTSLTSADLSGVTSIEEYVAAPSLSPPFSTAPSFQIYLCDCEHSSHHAIASSLCDLHVNQPNVRDKRVVNHIDHFMHPVAIIAPLARRCSTLCESGDFSDRWFRSFLVLL
jgi:hypothetical protein